MKLTLVAATGGIGRHLLDQALTAGHDVTVVVRSPSKLPPADVRVVTANLADPDAGALRAALTGADAVLSALGPTTKAAAGVAEHGTAALVTAAQATGVRRLLVVSAGPIGQVASPARPARPDPGDDFLIRYLLSPVLRRILRAHYADLARMEDVVQGSGLDWTIVRPPRLANGPRTGKYRTAYGQNLRGGRTISRADVADYLLRAADEPEAAKQTVAIAY